MQSRFYFDQKKEIHNYLLEYIEDSDTSTIEFQNLIDAIKSHGILENREELKHFLHLLINISNNYHRQALFFNKIEKILLYLKDSIKQNISNSEIYEIFVSNKRILLFLIHEQIITFDEIIIDDIIKRREKNGTKYFLYFIPEIKNVIKEEKMKTIEKDLNEYGSMNLENYESNRQIGENDLYICSLIRNDMIEEFVSYVNRTNYHLNFSIKPSIFETNSFLNENDPNLIEYAAFFGSIQIFDYLILNNASITNKL